MRKLRKQITTRGCWRRKKNVALRRNAEFVEAWLRSGLPHERRSRNTEKEGELTLQWLRGWGRSILVTAAQQIRTARQLDLIDFDFVNFTLVGSSRV